MLQHTRRADVSLQLNQPIAIKTYPSGALRDWELVPVKFQTAGAPTSGLHHPIE